jgi:hypothetical protein
MSNWTRSNVSREQFLRLVEVGQLPLLTAAVEWKVPDDEYLPRPQGVRGVVRGLPQTRLFRPRWRFIRGVLFEYRLQLQHLNPNNIQQMVAFEAMCEG